MANSPERNFEVDESLVHRLIPAAKYIRDSSSETLPVTTLVVGAAIFHPLDKLDPRLLLVQRSETGIFSPGLFEIPGGKVDPEDATILHALARETMEETGLRVTRAVRETSPFDYTTKRTSESGEVTTRLNCQLNFILEIEDHALLKLNPEEHQRSVWAREREVDSYPMSEEMNKVVKNVFQAMRRIAEEGIKSE